MTGTASSSVRERELIAAEAAAAVDALLQERAELVRVLAAIDAKTKAVEAELAHLHTLPPSDSAADDQQFAEDKRQSAARLLDDGVRLNTEALLHKARLAARDRTPRIRALELRFRAVQRLRLKPRTSRAARATRRPVRRRTRAPARSRPRPGSSDLARSQAAGLPA